MRQEPGGQNFDRKARQYKNVLALDDEEGQKDPEDVNLIFLFMLLTASKLNCLGSVTPAAIVWCVAGLVL